MAVHPAHDRAAPELPREVDAVAPTGAAPPYDAVIFDMDGVVTDTAAVHAAAWAGPVRRRPA